MPSPTPTTAPDENRPAPDPDPDPDPDAGPGRGAGPGQAPIDGRPRWAGPLGWAAGAAAVMALRLWVVSTARFPRIVADETAYLAMARLLGGGPRWNLGMAATYGPGYSVLLAPWFALDLSPDTVYRAAMLTNVVAAGLTFVAVEALTRRLTTLAPPWSLAASAVAASLPGLAVTGTLAWSDAVTPLFFALVVLTVLRLVERPTVARGAVAGLTVVAGNVVHARLLPVVGVVLLVVVALAVQRRLAPPGAGAVVALTVAALVAARAAAGAVHDRLYEPGGQVTAGLSDADGVARVGRLALATTGQVWYLLATTAGLAGLGAWALAHRWWRDVGGLDTLRRRRGPGHGRPGADPSAAPVAGLRALDPVASTAVLAVLGLPFAAGAVFISGGARGDQAVYGRYNEMFVAVLVTCGFSALVATRTWAARGRALGLVVAATVATGGLVWLTRLDALKGGYTPYTILGLIALEPRGPQRLRTATAIAVALVVVVVAASAVRRARPAALLVLAALLVVVGTVRSLDQIGPDRGSDPRHAADLGAILEPGDEVVYLMDGDTSVVEQFYRYQLYTPDLVALRAFGPQWERGRTFIVTGTDQPELPAAGYRLAWVDAGTGAGLWVGPGARQEALAAAGELLPAGLAGISPAMERAEVRFTAGPALEGEDLRARVVVTRPAGEPWPGLDRTAPPAGRVRLGVLVHGEECGCTVADGRSDLARWLPGASTRLSLPVEVDLGDLEPGHYRVSAQLLREGEARFGAVATATVTVER
ncbi:MAG TPA: hypothetical protein VEW93_05165 [Acidimicrobiales bacterium]|nr:hypothetical protein [Acidimicrobiales bacterium]